MLANIVAGAAVPVYALATVATDATSNGIDIGSIIAQTSSGLGLATFAYLFITAKIVSGPTHRRVLEENRELQTIILSRVIPALTRLADYIEDQPPPPDTRPRRRQ